MGQTNFAYVRIKNRGTQAATNVVVKGFHALPGVGLVFPTDWVAMATPSAERPPISPPTTVSASSSDRSNGCRRRSGTNACSSACPPRATPAISTATSSGRSRNGGSCRTTTISASATFIRVNNKLDLVLWEKLPFWIRNRGRDPVQLGVEIKLPKWLEQLGWKFDVPQITRERVTLKPDSPPLKVAIAMTKGKPFDEAVLQAGTRSRHRPDRAVRQRAGGRHDLPHNGGCRTNGPGGFTPVGRLVAVGKLCQAGAVGKLCQAGAVGQVGKVVEVQAGLTPVRGVALRSVGCRRGPVARAVP